MKNTTTVTHTDGTVSKRTSASATYTHAIVIGPMPTDAFVAENLRRAEYLDGMAERYENDGRNAAYAVKTRADAAKLRAEAALAAAGQDGHSNTPGVVRWSTRRDLAEKALSSFSWAAQEGRSLEVVEVDA